MSKVKIKNSTINVVMYHYVREIKNSKYPNLKGLEFKDFKKQIDFFCNNFNVLSNDDFVEIIHTKKIPNKPSFFLTFDDGYIDHYKYVFPYLLKKKISGVFYPPINTIRRLNVLDVNKIHFVLEKEQNRDNILNKINLFLKKKTNRNLENFNLSKLDLRSRYDNKKTLLIKRLLQFYLDKELRKKLVNHLFDFFIGQSDKDFANKLYMNEDHLKEMYNNNMMFGSHGTNHYWWNTLSKEKQEKEIKTSLNFFKKNNFNIDQLSVCYPYGAYNRNTLSLMRKYNIKFALTTSVGTINSKNLRDRYILPRMDTNDYL